MRFLGDAEVNTNSTPVNFGGIHSVTCVRCFLHSAKVDECESAAGVCAAIKDDAAFFNRAEFAKQIAQIVLRRLQAQPKHAKNAARLRRFSIASAAVPASNANITNG